MPLLPTGLPGAPWKQKIPTLPAYKTGQPAPFGLGQPGLLNLSLGGQPSSPTLAPRTLPDALPRAIEQAFTGYDELANLYRDALQRARQLGSTGISDIGRLISQYQSLAGQGPGVDVNIPDISFTPVTYTRSAEVGEALRRLGELSQTGGYSEQDIANLRERGISPIRAAYADAIREVERQRALQGGYSPAAPALLARMAREQSSRLAGAMTDVNARIAEAVAAGRRQMAPQLAQTALSESELANRIALENMRQGLAAQELQARAARERAELGLRGRELESQRQLAALAGIGQLLRAQQQAAEVGPQLELEALRGLTSLYGTSPALAETFGRQALAALPYDVGPRRGRGGILLPAPFHYPTIPR